MYIKKGKAVPLQAWSGPEGSRKLRFPDFTTTAQDGGKVANLSTGRLYPQEIHLVLIYVKNNECLRALTGWSESRSSRKVADRVLTIRVPEPGTSVEKLGDCQCGSTPHMHGTDPCEGPKANEFRRRQKKFCLLYLQLKHHSTTQNVRLTPLHTPIDHLHL